MNKEKRDHLIQRLRNCGMKGSLEMQAADYIEELEACAMTIPTTQREADERAMYEEHARQHNVQLTLDIDGKDYHYPLAKCGWSAWQARAAIDQSTRQAAPEAPAGYIHGDAARAQDETRAIDHAATTASASDAEEAAKLQTLLMAEFECYRTAQGGLYAWAMNALLDNSPHRMGRAQAPSQSAPSIKTWQERTGNHNIRPGSVKHMIAEIAELRAALTQTYGQSANRRESGE